MEFRVIPMPYWRFWDRGFLVQWRTDYLSFWHSAGSFQNISEAQKACHALRRANLMTNLLND